MSEEKKSRYNQSQNLATQKYIKNNLEEIKLRVKKGEKAKYKAAAQNAGTSMAQFIVNAMDEKIEREHLLPLGDISEYSYDSTERDQQASVE